MLPPNYFPDTNSFKLAGPPDHFRRSLWAFDDSLVVVPSRQGCYYRLAQRRPPNLTTAIINEALFKESDTKMLASYGLVPVTTIMATPNWSNPFLLEELRRRSVHRMGGAEKVNAMLEAQEADEAAAKEAINQDMLSILSNDAWKLYLKKLGLRSHMWSPAIKKSKPHSGVGAAGGSTSALLKPDQPSRQASSSLKEQGTGGRRQGIKVGSIFLP